MDKQFRFQLVSQMLVLCTSAFGLVAALAWNTAIQTFINDFVKPFIPAGGSAVISQLVYAVIITIFVITVTIYLTRLKDGLEKRSTTITIVEEKPSKKTK